MENQKKKTMKLLFGVFPIFLTISFVGIFYLLLPVYDYLTIPEQIGLLIGFYLLFLGICGFVYVWKYSQRLKDVLTEEEHGKNALTAMVISVILIGIQVILALVNNYSLDSSDIYAIFRIWMFYYLISWVAIESWAGYRKRKKTRSK